MVGFLICRHATTMFAAAILRHATIYRHIYHIATSCLQLVYVISLRRHYSEPQETNILMLTLLRGAMHICCAMPQTFYDGCAGHMARRCQEIFFRH